MLTLKAHVENGRLVLDVPAELPEGAIAEVHLLDADDEMDAEERLELLRSIDEGLADVDAGAVHDLKDVVAALGA